MVKCPHCNEYGISSWSKWKAGIANPAICKFCGKHSSISGNTLGISGGIFHLLFITAAVISFYYWSLLPFLGLAFLYLITGFIFVKWIPLKPLTESQVKKNKRISFIFIAIFIILIVLIGLLNI